MARERAGSSGFIREAPKKPARRKVPEMTMRERLEIFAPIFPEKKPPRQKKIIERVKVRDNCGAVQEG
jgi:hypothetical protein